MKRVPTGSILASAIGSAIAMVFPDCTRRPRREDPGKDHQERLRLRGWHLHDYRPRWHKVLHVYL